jgi:hypothetical protein
VQRIVPVTYSQIRIWHFTETLARWLKGLDKAAMMLLAVAGPGLLALVVLLLLAIADGLNALSLVSTSFIDKLITIGAWQLGTLCTLWALREAIFMPRTATFFAALPIKASQQLRSDLALCMLSYSLLWLAVAWAIGRGFLGGVRPGAQTLLSISAFIGFSLVANLLLLKLRQRAVPSIVVGLLVFSLPGGHFLSLLCALAAFAVGGIYLHRTYLQPSSLIEQGSTPNAVFEPFVIRTGLTVLLFINELRAAVLLRFGCVFGLLALLPLLTRFTQDAGMETAGFVVVMAAAAIAFHDLPALCQATAFSKMGFVAGQKHFVRRVRLFAHGMPMALYACAFLGAHYITRMTMDSTQAISTQLLAPSVFFTTTFLMGTTAATLGYPSVRWWMPVVNFVAVVVMSGYV